MTIEITTHSKAQLDKILSALSNRPRRMANKAKSAEHVKVFADMFKMKLEDLLDEADSFVDGNESAEDFRARVWNGESVDAVGDPIVDQPTAPESVDAAEAPVILPKVIARIGQRSERKLTAILQINPFPRVESKSHKAWEMLAASPGITYGELKAKGCRMRAISHGILCGWIEVSQ